MAANKNQGGWRGGHRDRHEHGGASMHPDDEALARRTESERVDAGLEDYDPNDVPPATDTPPLTDVTDTEMYREEKAESSDSSNRVSCTRSLSNIRSRQPDTTGADGGLRCPGR